MTDSHNVEPTVKPAAALEPHPVSSGIAPQFARWTGFGDGDRWPLVWVASAMVALISLAAWQATPAWTPLGIAAVAAAVSAITVGSLRAPKLWGTAAVISLAFAISIAGSETRKLRIIAATYESYSLADMDRRVERVANSVHNAATLLSEAAAALANDSVELARLVEATAASKTVAPPQIDGGAESAILVFRDSQLIANAGQTRIPVAVGDSGVHVIRTAFHTSMISRVTSADGRTQVIAVVLLWSAPPADRFARSLSQVIAASNNAPRVVFESADSAYARPGTSMMFIMHGGAPVSAVRALPFSEGETRVLRLQHARARTAVPLAVAALFVLIVSWRRPALTRHRLISLCALLGVVAVAPLNALSNVSLLFDAASYFAPVGGPLTANIAALLISAILVLGALLLRLHGQKFVAHRGVAAFLVLVIAALGPFVLRDLARGITLPASGVTYGLWISWQLAIALVGVSILLAGAAAGQVALGASRGLHPVVAPLIAICASMLAPVLWDAAGAWPQWYLVLWVASIAAFAVTRSHAGALVVAATFVAGCGAVTLTWGATVRERMELAAFDTARMSAVDENAFQLLQRFASTISTDSISIATPDALLRQYAASELAMAGYPALLARWAPHELVEPVVTIELAPVTDTVGAQASVAASARITGVPQFRAVEDGATTNLVAAIPDSDGMVTTVAVPPRTRLLPADPFASLTGIAGERSAEPPFQLTLGAPPDGVSQYELVWHRRGTAMHGDGMVGSGAGVRAVHVEVELRGLSALIPRGALLVLLDVAIVLVIWAVTAIAEGSLSRWLTVQRTRFARSYRVRLSATLIAFFIAPAAIFASWFAYRLRDDDRSARELLIRETLRGASVANVDSETIVLADDLAGAPYFIYQQAQLVSASDPVLNALAPLGRLLPEGFRDADEAFSFSDTFVSKRLPVRNREALIGFKWLNLSSPTLIVATPARGDEFTLDARRADLGILVLFATSLGVIAAFWFSGFAARALERPVGDLREAALSLASGTNDIKLGNAPATEFAPVYQAFSRMSQDLTSSRLELEAAHRRTEAVLQHVASGVVALRQDGTILFANPRAVAMLASASVNDRTTVSIVSLPQDIESIVQKFLGTRDDEDSFELQLNSRQLRGRLTRLSSGAVLTVDDVTELASAQRVLAWGEMARQVAHEIKNPLTPIRLGVQHLQRAFRDGRGDFGLLLDSNVTRILSEIDHLDEIARSFSRYGTAPENRAMAEPINSVDIVQAVIELEQLGDARDVTWLLTPNDSLLVPAALGKADEFKEVVLNIFENARLAGATTVSTEVKLVADKVHLEIRDNGGGIPLDVMPRIFEPHFSTRTSGSGLGLAISRRLLEGWGGTITVDNASTGGVVVQLTLLKA